MPFASIAFCKRLRYRNNMKYTKVMPIFSRNVCIEYVCWHVVTYSLDVFIQEEEMLGMRQPLICQVAKCASHGVQKTCSQGI